LFYVGVLENNVMRRLMIGIVLMAACGGATKHEPRATTGVRAYMQTLRSDDPRGAWNLLSADARDGMSYDEFAAAWKASAKERERQAAQMEESLKGEPDLSERASVKYDDGKTVQLHHDGGNWRLDSGLVSRTIARSPLDAIEIFARSLEGRDFNAAMAILTSRRRDGINKFVNEFAASLRKQKGEEGIQFLGSNRAELAWDENGVRYKMTLVREGDEWRVDDFDIQPAAETSP
jgi:hypothetical protein